jgi:hypothetical protein
MESLPAELTEDVLVNLPLRQLLQLCRINQQTGAICKAEGFWRRFLWQHYHLEPIPGVNVRDQVRDTDRLIHDYRVQPIPGVNPRILIQKAQRILNGFFARDIYPSYRVLDPMVQYLSDDEINFEVNNVSPNQLWSVESIESIYNYLPIDPFPEMVVPEPRGNINLDNALNFASDLGHLDTRALTSDEQKYISEALGIVSQPTEYFTPRGLITIPFDVDRVDAFHNKLVQMQQHVDRIGRFNDFIHRIFRITQKSMYARYAGSFTP